jgi:hypothetical protein
MNYKIEKEELEYLSERVKLLKDLTERICNERIAQFMEGRGQVYREYPDGRIEVQQVFATGNQFEVKVLHVLGASDADTVRKEYELF